MVFFRMQLLSPFTSLLIIDRLVCAKDDELNDELMDIWLFFSNQLTC